MSDFDSLMYRVLPSVPACPDQTIVQSIRDAFDRLCKEARIWRIDDDFAVEQDRPQVIFVPAGAMLWELESARYCGQPLEPQTLRWLDDNVRCWRTGNPGSPRYMTQVELDSFYVTPCEPGQTIRVLAYLRPAERATRAPTRLLNEYAQTIAYGALGMLMAAPDKPWTQPEGAIYNSGLFQAEIDKLMGKAVKGQQVAPARSKPRFF